MNISFLKKQLISANSAIFEVNKKGIVWSNNYFDSLFNFLNEYDLKNNLSLKSSKNNFYLKLKINKESTAYDSQFLVKNSESSIYKINDEQINQKLKNDIDLARNLGLRGTPAFIISEEIFFGYIDKDDMVSILNQQ